jgi:hypothetical protein
MLFPYELIELIDKNSLWGGLNIQKWAIVCQLNFSHKILGLGPNPRLAPCTLLLAKKP